MVSDVLTFWKYQGIGNDFVLVDRPVTADQARALCDRSLGVGADGVLIVTPGEADVPPPRGAVTVWNSDGSPAEICGNGLRCATLHLHEHTFPDETTMHLETGAGLRRCVIVEHQHPGLALVQVEMGIATLELRAIPVQGSGSMVEEPLEIGSQTLKLTAVGIGNPHAVTFDEVPAAWIHDLGPLLEHHPLFPAGVNAGFARVIGPNHIELTVWERGAGLTGACGSGACAAAVAACTTGRATLGSPLRIEQPGGTLTITIEEDTGQVIMKGPAQRVFNGELDLSLFG